ncbi:thioredoxin family protein [Peribacillus loiseleuriae]|uniref:thioredoxin family protein n=1 Tax=Peribacillus loiseleuriae TaxID=1679170 RepID=UPI003D08F228
MKKIIIFLVIILALFATLGIVTTMQKDEKLKAADNPYGTDKLAQATIDQLDDPNYQNIILPAQLDKKLKAKENVAVYYFSPLCEHCKRTTPVVAPLAEEMGIDLVQYNLLEFEQGWNDYNLKETPTIVFYKNGVEQDRIIGENEEATFKHWFEVNGVN